MDNDRNVYLLAENERKLVSGGPALVSPDGTRLEVPLRVYEALQEVERLLRSGKAVQLKPLEPELGIAQAAEVINMHPAELQANVDRGEVPHRRTGIVPWLRLTDVLAFDRRLQKQRAAAMQELADEERWDENGGGAAD